MTWNRASLVRQLREWGIACDDNLGADGLAALQHELAERMDLAYEDRREALRPLEHQAAMEAYWPGITQYAEASSGVECLVGAARGEVLIVTSTGRQTAVQQKPPLPAAHPAYGFVATDPPLWPWPRYWRTESVPLSPHPDRAVAAFTGMALFWDRTAQLWREPHWGNEDPPMLVEEAEEATSYLLKHWLRKHGDEFYLRVNLTNLVLNVAREATPQQATWVATCLQSRANWRQLIPRSEETLEARIAAALREASKTVASQPARLPVVWDWTRYETRDGGRRIYCEPRVDWLTRPEMTMPWPYWAEEQATKWRLLEHAADLLFEANQGAWSDNKAHRTIREPSADEWPVVRYLLSYAAEQDHLHLNFAPPEGDSIGFWFDYNDLPVVQLWGLLQGWAHLRKCTHCDRWVLTTGLRPRRTCNSACRTAAHRKTPGARLNSTAPRRRENVTRESP